MIASPFIAQLYSSSLAKLAPSSFIQSSASLVFSSLVDESSTSERVERTFEPIVPDTTQLLAFGSIAALSVIVVYVWANEVVPVSRTNLAISKRSGAVKNYLDELQLAGNVTVADDSSSDAATDSDSRGLERWLFADWLNTMDRTNPRQKKEPALPILKNAKWNSGDNPVLAATALILLGVTLTSITERVASIVQ